MYMYLQVLEGQTWEFHQQLIFGENSNQNMVQ